MQRYEYTPYLLHDTDELYRLRLAAAELRFATEVVADATEQKEDEMKDDDDEYNPLAINYGQCVLEWLPYGDSPQFKSLREELVYNEDTTLDRDLLDRMTIQCAAGIEDTDYTLDEALGLKTYADATVFQSELRKAHWKGMKMKMKRAYFHWAMTLYEAHLYHSRPIPAISGKPRGVYHGLNKLFTMSKELPIYLGPFSVSTKKTVAKQFSNEQGLLFSINPSYVNPYKFAIGIDMLTFSCFKNEAEVLFNSQPIPIKQTEMFGDAMVLFVNHFLFSLKNRKTRINDVAAFYNKLGVEWNEEWIPLVLNHKLLFRTTRFDGRKTIDRLFAELDIMDQRLVDSMVEMQHDDGRPYIVYLVEDLKVKQVLQHYRLMTSTFTILKYSKEVNCSWLKWEPNNKINLKMGVTDVDDSCFDDAEYQINGKKAFSTSSFWADAIHTVCVRSSCFFGARWIPIYGQKMQKIAENEYFPHDFGALLKMDVYSNGCIFVDDTPSPDYCFQIGQKVKRNDGSVGKITQLNTHRVCVKFGDYSIKTFQWFERKDIPLELTLYLSDQRNLSKYEFAVREGEFDHSNNLSTAKKHNISYMDQFTISCSSMLDQIDETSSIGVYVQRKQDDQCKWGRLKLLKYPAFYEPIISNTVCADAMLRTLQKTHFEITQRRTFLKHFGLDSDSLSEWTSSITEHPLLFAVTRYRRKLIIERLIVELELWSTLWIHRILQQNKRNNKPMLQWLVKDRGVNRLYDHYRVFMSVNVREGELLNRRWLKFKRDMAMSGKTGFYDSAESCFEETKYYADGVSITSDTTSIMDTVRKITIRNHKLFGERDVVIHNFQTTSTELGTDINQFVYALKVDQYSNGCIFIDNIPSADYPFCIEQEVQFDDGATGKISRVTVDDVCIKMKSTNNFITFRWIPKKNASKRFTFKFPREGELRYYYVGAIVQSNIDPVDSSELSELSTQNFYQVKDLLVPCKDWHGYHVDSVMVGIYAKPSYYEWSLIKTIDYHVNKEPRHAFSVRPDDDLSSAVSKIISILLETDCEIRVNDNSLISAMSGMDQKKELMSLIGSHPLLFHVTAFRRRLIIERLIVELKLWSPDWIHRILREKKDSKPMLQWLVEDRRLSQLHDHYRVFNAFDVKSSNLLGYRWLKFKKIASMKDKRGFQDSEDSCFQMSQFEADGVPIKTTTVFVKESVRALTVRNERLFGGDPVVLHQFQEHLQSLNDIHFVDALKLDQYSNGIVFLDDIPTKVDQLCLGRDVQFDDGAKGTISRVVDQMVCIKIEDSNDCIKSFRWISKSEAFRQITLRFQHIEDLNNLYFAATLEGTRSSRDLSQLSSKSFSDPQKFALPCQDFPKHVSGVISIEIYAKPRKGDYQWIRIKTLKYSLQTIAFNNLSAEYSEADTDEIAVQRLIMTLKESTIEYKHSNQGLRSFGLKRNRKSKWMSIIAIHPMLFDVTAYRQRLIIERLIVELRLLSTQWIHRILEMNMKGKPMLQWLVEDRKVVPLHEHYGVFFSRFKDHYSTLWNRTWLRIDKNSSMNSKPGFGSLSDSCFAETEYKADGVIIDHDSTYTLRGSVQQITITNTRLFGHKSIVLQEFDEQNDGDDYFADDFTEALCFSDDHVLLNYVPSASHPFCVGQDVLVNNGTIGHITKITADAVWVKFSNNKLPERQLMKSEIPMSLTLTFRHREEFQQYRFAITANVDQKPSDYYYNIGSKSFPYIKDFEFSKQQSVDAVHVWVRPYYGHYHTEYKWFLIKSLYKTFDSIPMPSTSEYRDYRHSVDCLFSWIRQRFGPIKNPHRVLSAFGLRLDTSSEWMPLIAAHPMLFAVTVRRKHLLIERLIVELDLLSRDLALRMIKKWYQGKMMLEYLVEDRKVKKLYVYYRVITSGFKAVFRSYLLDRMWMEFRANDKIKDDPNFKGVDDSCLEASEYVLNGVVYSRDSKPSVPWSVIEFCRNTRLLGDEEVVTRSNAQDNTLQIPAIPSVGYQVPDDHMSWFRSKVATAKYAPIELEVSSHRGHSSSYHPNNLLESGTSKYYYNYGQGSTATDWIVFEKLSVNTIPTKIVIRNHNYESGLKLTKIFGSVDNVVFEEWIYIKDISKRSDVLQHYELDPASIHFAWSKGFRYFKLCSMENRGASYLRFYEFGIYGVRLHHHTDKADKQNVSKFIREMNLNQKLNRIVTRPRSDSMLRVGKKIEIKRNSRWIQGMVSRECADKICIKCSDRKIISFHWVNREQIPQKLRFIFSDQQNISKLTFAAAVGVDGAENMNIHSDLAEYRFYGEFEISLNELVAHSSAPDTICIFAKPTEHDFEFELIKKIKCNKLGVYRFAVDEQFGVHKQYVIGHEGGGKFEVVSTEDIVIFKTGAIAVSYCKISEEAIGQICLVSAGNVINQGVLSCDALSGGKSEESTIYVDTEGVFKNEGTIIGENGSVLIECAQYENTGEISPAPNVIIKNVKWNTKQVFRDVMKRENPITLKVCKYREHYGQSSFPHNLLMEGTGCYYRSGRKKGPPAEDWIIFRTTQLYHNVVYPKSIVIRNHTGSYALKKVIIEGSSDGIKFYDWMEISNISNKHYDLQRFAVSPFSGYIAWKRAYIYFRIKMVENYGGSYNQFYEFRINGLEDK